MGPGATRHGQESLRDGHAQDLHIVSARPAHRTAGDRLTIEVRDDGPGIAPEERHRVFQRFARGERATGGGTGLGLAIARWVVELHDGTIAVINPDSLHNGQSGIQLTLPRNP